MLCDTSSPPPLRPAGSTVVRNSTFTGVDCRRVPARRRQARSTLPRLMTLERLDAGPSPSSTGNGHGRNGQGHNGNGHYVPRLTPLQAVRRHIGLVLLPVVVFVGVAVGYAGMRSPVYSSNAQLNVGGVTLTVQSIPGYAVATAQLAVAYSRSATATPVVRAV